MKRATKSCVGGALRAACAGAALALVSCASAPVIPDDMSAQELIQNGQSSFESGHYKAALRYFNAVVERYEDDPAVYIEAKYEIGHLYMKKKQYKAAVPILEEIRDVYPQVPPGTLPAAYEKLARLELAKLSDEQLAKIHAELQKEALAREQDAASSAQAAPEAAPAAAAAPEAESEAAEADGSAAAQEAGGSDAPDAAPQENAPAAGAEDSAE